MRFDLKQDVVSLTDFARNTKEHTKELTEGGRTRILTQNGKAAAVVLSIDTYEKMAHDAEEYQMDLRLRAALKDYAEGNHGKPFRSEMGKIRRNTTKRRSAAS